MKENKISKKKKKRSQLTQSKSKRDMTGKQKKRLSALEELMVNDDEEKQPPVVHSSISYEETVESADGDTEAEEKNEENNNGILGKIKGFYDKADSMAASQALLLNKELEDRGVIDKITDESGLKVIGKDAAAEANNKKQKDNQNEGN